MSRIDPSSSTPVPIDTPTEPGPSPAPSRSKDTPTPAARNEVRAYDGPSARAPRGPASQPAPASSGPAISAGELTLRGGRLGPPPASSSSAEVPANMYSDVRSHLTRNLVDWRVSGCDVKAVHTALGTLQPGAYRAALERMERDGLLGEYVKAQDPATRTAFLEQAESKGMLERRKGTAPAGPLGYPAEPDFFRNDAKLPESMRGAVNEHAMDVGSAFYRAHTEYLGRYVDAVNGAKSLRALRALGPPQQAQLKDNVLGIGRKDPAGEAYAAQWRRALGPPDSVNRAYQTVNARMRELTDERPGGSIQLHGKGSLTSHGVKLSDEVQVDTRGKVGMKEEAGVVLSGGPLEVELTQSRSGEKNAETTLDLGLLKLSVDSEGTKKVELGAGKAASVYVTLNEKKAELGGGVIAELEAGDKKLEGETGFNMKALAADRVRESFDKDHRGLFDLPRELEAGTSWDALTEKQRAAYGKQDWTREEWTQTLAREQRKPR
ncbi:hypothetical protein [Pyxidicoccus caerfyrddinensis]|uniref:hypothetical protein n=1 Tax=Pyxidicoccus caerfyrddinensis TaxID=2709663 RepID=UPI001F082D78|nr:hypothetical protein [Pyxidicoccus caerfyrddinensis]